MSFQGAGCASPGRSSDPPAAVTTACIPPIQTLLVEAMLKPIDPKNPILRSALSHVILPDPERLAAMNGMAILAIQAHTQDRSELPLDGILMQPTSDKGAKAKEVSGLPRIFPAAQTRELPEASELGAKLGRYVELAYYFVPTAFLRKSGTLWAAFSGRKQYLSAMTLPLPRAVDLSKEFDRMPDPAKAPDPEVTVQLIRKEFCADLPNTAP
jgi:hypothetical protein